MKVKALVSLLALAAAGSSFAAPVVTATGSELFFWAFDTAQTKMYILDTGLLSSTAKDGSINLSKDLTTDANWNSFVSSVGVDNINWVFEGFSTASGANKFLLGTVGSGTTVTPGAGAGNSNGAQGQINTNLNAALSNTGISAGTSEIVLAGTGAFLPMTPSNASFLGDGSIVLNMVNAIGAQNVSLFNSAVSSTSNAGKVNLSLLAPVAGLTTGGLLTVAAVTPSVPEPSSYALALTALAGIGFIARRRTK